MSSSLTSLHPGKILKEDFLGDYALTQYALAKATRIPQSRLTEIIQGKRGISADTAVRLSAYFGNSARFWLNLQIGHDLDQIDESKIRAQVAPHPVQPPSTPPKAGQEPTFTPEKVRAASRPPRSRSKTKSARRAA